MMIMNDDGPGFRLFTSLEVEGLKVEQVKKNRLGRQPLA